MSYIIKQEHLDALTPADKEVITAIYHHRCLNEPLLYKHFYSKEKVKRSHAEERIKALTEAGYLSPVDYGQEYPALFLTEAGVACANRLMIYPDPTMKSVGSFGLKMKEQIINHQLALNAVVLDFKEEAEKRKIPYRYYDGKFMEYNAEVMPDGLIQTNEYDIFLEMDMNSERQAELLYKWDNYRSYLNTTGFFCKEKKTIVFFLLGNVTDPGVRRYYVLSSIGKGLLDKIASKFDIYVDTPDQLLDLLFNELLKPSDDIEQIQSALRLHGFSMTPAAPLNKFVSGPDYGFYARMLSDKTKQVMVKDGKAQEFLLDNAVRCLPASCLTKVVGHNSTTLGLTSKAGRPIPYLVVVEGERLVSADLSAVNARGTQNVYFTTIQRLRDSVTFPEALFQVDQMGRVSHFSDFSLSELVYERTIQTQKNKLIHERKD